MRSLLFLVLVCYASAYHIYKDMSSDQEDSSEHGVGLGKKKTTCDCGRANRATGRIVNGVEAQVNQFPFVAGLTRLDYLDIFCGGTIITERHVITAAHCTVGEEARELGVVLGAHDVRNKSEDRVTIPLESYVNHKEYNGAHDRHDISLLTLKSSIKYTQKIGPACLPHSSSAYSKISEQGKYVKVMGWGTIKSGGEASYWLRQTNLRVIPIDTCRKAFSGIIPKGFDNQLCTFGRNRDTCQGDSGGPVVYVDPETNRYTLVGLVSYGADCAKVTPGVNTKVEAYLDWIQKTIAASKYSGTSCKKIN